jgi:membrane-associated phospholipid phosphatase
MKALPLVGAVDRVVLGRLGRPTGPPAHVASTVSALTRGGIGWHATSLALIAARRPATVRTAIAGSLAWIETSLLVAAIKRLTARRRPTLAVGPPTRSSSMPSSHTATAIAYATAATIQRPAAAPLLIPAATVGWSRLKTRRHFPTDVIVGVVIGGAVGAVTGFAVRHARISGDPTNPVPPPSIDTTLREDTR